MKEMRVRFELRCCRRWCDGTRVPAKGDRCDHSQESENRRN
jgi:hypothetical protein